MDDNIIHAMEAELDQLEAKASAIRSVITLYRSGTSAPPVTRAKATTESSSGDGGSNVSEAILRVARELCDRQPGVPVPTLTILDELQNQGIRVLGTVPRNVVSSVMSRSGEFTANGRTGWTSKGQNSGQQTALFEKGAPEGAPEAEEVSASSNDSADDFE